MNPPHPRHVAICAWALYDFAITVFSMNIISRYFGLWVTESRHGQDLWYSLAFMGSMAVAALLMPVLGTYSDTTGGRVRYLRYATLLCVTATASLASRPSLAVGLVLFGLANVGVQLGGMFYDALLPTVSGGRQVGRISGLGVACGYVGSFTGLMVVQPFVAAGGYDAVFLPTAILIGIMALPAMVTLRDGSSPVPPARRGGLQRMQQAVAELWRTVKTLPQAAGLWRFLASTFLAFNAINTVVLFMGVYVKRTLGLPERQIDVVLMTSAGFAMAGSLASGWLTDRFGPRQIFRWTLIGWSAILVGAACSSHPAIVWVLGPLVGMALGCTWTTARTLMVALAPPGHIGECFGLYSLVGRAASNLGPLLWGVIVWGGEGLGVWRDRLALLSLVVFFVMSLALLRRLPDARIHPAGLVS